MTKERNKLRKKKKSFKERKHKITREIFVYKEKLSWHYRKKEWKNQTLLLLHIINMYEKKNTKGLFLQFKIKKIKSNLEINVAQCHECLKKGPYLLKSIPTKHPHAVRPKYPYSFYGMPKSLLLDLSFVSILFVCASVHNKKIHLIYITSFCPFLLILLCLLLF